MMINDDDCDIEPLRETDFEDGYATAGAIASADHCIEMCKLAVLSELSHVHSSREADSHSRPSAPSRAEGW